jgi:hypothetical protein
MCCCFRRPVRIVRYSSKISHVYSLLPVDAIPSSTIWSLLVPASTVRGAPKCQNLTLEVICTIWLFPWYYCRLSVPQVVDLNSLTMNVHTSQDHFRHYEPAQNVFMQEQFVTQANAPQTFHSHLAWNLQSNDAICILMRPVCCSIARLERIHWYSWQLHSLLWNSSLLFMQDTWKRTFSHRHRPLWEGAHAILDS